MIHQNLPKIPSAEDMLLNLKAQTEKGYIAYKTQDQQALTEAFEWIKSLEQYIGKQLAPQEQDTMPPLHLILPIIVEKLIADLHELIHECKDDKLNQQAEENIDNLNSIPKNFPDEGIRQKIHSKDSNSLQVLLSGWKE